MNHQLDKRSEVKAVTISNLICPDCGEVRMRTPSGTVCPNGHGRIHPKATATQIKTAQHHKWANGLPRATRVKSKQYEIAGREGVFSPVKFVPTGANATSRVPTGATCDDGVIAVTIGSRVMVRKFQLQPTTANQA